MNNPNYKFLLVQGRAIPQTDNSLQYFPSNWKEEFPIINTLGFSGIEWIYDKKSESTNPILTETGRNDMLNLSKKYNVDLENIVFDWFLEYPLLKDDRFSIQEKIKKLLYLLDVSKQSGFRRVIFPILEKNSLDDDNQIQKFVDIFKENVLEYLEKLNIELHLETSLPTEKELSILKKFNSKYVKICFDMGNSTSYGFEPKTSIYRLAKNIGSVHIKDRKLNGPSMPLGQGDVDFYRVFESLSAINFHGPISFQVYRNKDSNNISILKQGIHFINDIINKTDVNER